ncbi:MAG: hypothetical protein DRO98_04935 [Archaeoglobales archaeon]|nr:MAG: hypothetical protein DRO98_04935 [Archaeoglobales archaeon]
MKAAGPARTPKGRKPEMRGKVPTRGITREDVPQGASEMGLPTEQIQWARDVFTIPANSG